MTTEPTEVRNVTHTGMSSIRWADEITSENLQVKEWKELHLIELYMACLKKTYTVQWDTEGTK